LLIDLGAKIGIKNKRGMTAIDCMTIASLQDYPEMAELLKEFVKKGKTKV